MKNNVTLLVVLILILSGTFSKVNAQDTLEHTRIKYNDVIKLNNGFIIKCNILDFDQNGIYIEKTTRDTIYLVNNMFKVIFQDGASRIIRMAEKQMYEKKWLTSIDAGLVMGNSKDKIISGTCVDIGLSRRLDKNAIHLISGGVSFLSSKFNENFLITQSDIISANLGYQYGFKKERKKPYFFVNFGKVLHQNIDNSLFNYSFKLPKNLSVNSGVGMEFKNNSYAYRISASYFYLHYKENYDVRNSYDFSIRKVLLKIGIIL